jgi:hypothetical protein
MCAKPQVHHVWCDKTRAEIQSWSSVLPPVHALPAVSKTTACWQLLTQQRGCKEGGVSVVASSYTGDSVL